MIEKLKAAGIAFTDGLSGEELRGAEEAFGFRFPAEIASFLSCACPAGERFFDYRDLSAQNLRRFLDFQRKIKGSFLFDLEHNEKALRAVLGELSAAYPDREAFRGAVMDALEGSVRLVPFYAHRCFLDGMDGMPIISFCQAVDTIFYGSDFENYLENEFLFSENRLDPRNISDKMSCAGIWRYIVN